MEIGEYFSIMMARIPKSASTIRSYRLILLSVIPLSRGIARKLREPLPIKTFDKYLWSANQELQAIAETNIHVNRTVSTTPGTEGRWVWSPLHPAISSPGMTSNNDGIVDSDGNG